ncbi:MAG TPA: hypothetical protein VG964_03840 [Candidatus Saccharimonadales bacterium]|nr:hypothetical protein [Candidatus Saccharimonadales bacterium]
MQTAKLDDFLTDYHLGTAGCPQIQKRGQSEHHEDYFVESKNQIGARDQA